MKLILVNLALLSTVTWQVARPPPAPPQPVTPAAVAVQPKVDTAAPQADTPRRDYAAVSERPIFFADRRVPEPDAVIEVVEEEVIEEELIEETEPPRDISLLGTVIAGDVTLALVVPVGGDAQRVGVGDLVAGWTVDEIQPNLVRVSGSEGPRQLKIERGTSGKDGRAVARNYGARQRTPAQAAGAGTTGQSAGAPGPRGAAGQRAQAGRSDGAANRGGNPANSGVAAGGGVTSRAAAGSAAQANGNGAEAGDAAATTATGGNTTAGSAAIGNATSDNNPFSNGASQTAGNVTPGTNVNGNVVAVPTVTVGTSGFNAEAVRLDENGNVITRTMADYTVGAEVNDTADP